MMKKISIDPITRLEGHGKIDIFLNEKGKVENAYFQVPELRGFERFCQGRLAEDMPQITSRICGVCPVAHHFASTKALDDAFKADPPEPAKKLRELIYNAYMIYDHILHFYFLASPDFIVGPKAPKSERNILGVIKKAGLDVGKEVIKHRAYGQKMTQIIGGKATHPVCGLPGGMSKAISEEEREDIEKMARSCVDFSQFSLKLFDDVVLKNKEYMDFIQSDFMSLKVYNMGLVDKNNHVNFYDGKIRVTSPEGKEFAKYDVRDYLKYVREHVEEWSYVKFPYLKDIGWNGLVDGKESGIYRVGPLGRLNAADGMSTPLANEEYKRMYETFGSRPVNSTLAFHWARLIEILNASEVALKLSQDPDITSTDLRTPPGKPGEGFGVVEAARGTLIHHYKLTEDGLIEKVNLIVATTSNMGPICMSVREAAKGLIEGPEVDEGLLNMVEMAFRAYDPCLACASHFLPGQMPLEVNLYDRDRKKIKTLTRNAGE